MLRTDPKQEETMSLSDYRVGTSIAVADLDGCRKFYEENVGLAVDEAFGDQMTRYSCGGDSTLTVYKSPDHAGKATGTVAGWEVPDLKAIMDEMRTTGVEFKSYDGTDGPPTDENDIFNHGSFQVAWFQDPEGNTFAINQNS
jgi:predicted enzyme related to lactoylglutathione lyase